MKDLEARAGRRASHLPSATNVIQVLGPQPIRSTSRTIWERLDGTDNLVLGNRHALWFWAKQAVEGWMSLGEEKGALAGEHTYSVGI